MATDFLTPELITGLRLVADTAALVLIWLVQLVIYPAFMHFNNTDFRRWHPAYTRRVTYVVLPVMLFQGALYAGAMWAGGAVDVWLNTILITVAWAVTFLRAVPLHGALDREDDHLETAATLLRTNGVRTMLWTLTWLITVIGYLANF